MEKDQGLVHTMEPVSSPHSSMKNVVWIFLIISILGVGTGYLVANTTKASYVVQKGGETQTAGAEKGTTYGVPDEKTFKDQAEGVLKEGGIEGEGAYHLERPGGVSQNVYLTSSTIDLSAFIGKKVKVWGETNSSKRAGWLMDVGRLQIL